MRQCGSHVGTRHQWTGGAVCDASSTRPRPHNRLCATQHLPQHIHMQHHHDYEQVLYNPFLQALYGNMFYVCT